MSSLRRRVRGLLGRGAFAEVLALARSEPRLVRALVSLLYDPEELLRWRAVSAIGRLAGESPELVRPWVTRLLWTLTDESGGIGWSSAPALGEIGRHAPALLASCVRVVIHYLEEPTLLAGALWAIGRLAATYPLETAEAAPEIERFLESADPAVRAHAAFALGQIGDRRFGAGLRHLAGDVAAARIYLDDDLVTREVREWAQEAAGRLRPALQ